MSMSEPSVDQIILGCSGLAGMFDPIKDEQAEATVVKAIELGVRNFDTAPHYGLGLSEERLGAALGRFAVTGAKGYTGLPPIKIWTKVGRVIKLKTKVNKGKDEVEEANLAGAPTCLFPDTPTDRAPVLDYTAKGVVTSHADSLRRLSLGGVKVELHGIRLHDAETPSRIDDTLKAGGAIDGMVALKKAGSVQDVGLGMNNPRYIMQILREAPGTIDTVMMAGSWNLLNTSGYEVLMECQKQGIEVHNAGIFASGLLVGGSTLDYAPAPQVSGWGVYLFWNDLQ